MTADDSDRSSEATNSERESGTESTGAESATPRLPVKKYRVLRFIEYVYDSPEFMERDMANWTTRTPFTSSVRMRSTHLPFEVIEEMFE